MLGTVCIVNAVGKRAVRPRSALWSTERSPRHSVGRGHAAGGIAMWCSGWVLGLLLVLQVPAPAPGNDAGRELESVRKKLLASEHAALVGLAERLSREGKKEAAQQVRQRMPRPVEPDGPTRLSPLPEVVGTLAAESGSLPDELKDIRDRAAAGLFELAMRAGKSNTGQYALASVCLRAVLERQPDHKEARRLLGYVPHQGGWATPYAVRQIKQGYVDHPIFGWIPSDSVPHFDGGELPAPCAARNNRAGFPQRKPTGSGKTGTRPGS